MSRAVVGPGNHESAGGASVVADQPSIMNALSDLIAERKARPPEERSYVVSLLKGGVPKIAAKITEEAGEVVEAAEEPGEEGKEHLVKEVADLVFHAVVMLGSRDVHWSEVENELGRRFGISGIVEKESRGKGPA
jgi:phosphoribosyl-ATP pyrophosphohydrolase